MSELESWRLFWAKTDRANEGKPNYDSEWTRPLWAHLLDVGNTALLLWECFVPDTFRHRVAVDLQMREQDAGCLLSLWIGLHDIGKAIPTFQREHKPSKKWLEEAGFSFDFHERQHHGHASIAILYDWLQQQERNDVEAAFFEHIAAFVGFHHGRLYPKGNPRRPRSGWRADVANEQVLGDDTWKAARYRLLKEVWTIWHAHYPGKPAATLPAEALPTWLLGFAGWASLADWLGSMATCFDRDTGDDLNAYIKRSRAGAEAALHKAGFDVPAAMQTMAFKDMFGFEPRPLQQCLATLSPESDAPTLTIVEAPTGEGKTEGAFALAALQQARHKQGGGLYIAMPTQATSNGLFERTQQFLGQAHDEARSGFANFRLVHGNADLHPAQEELITDPAELAELYDDEDAKEGRIRTIRWFLSRKRSLLAPYGLGTVDQAMLGVLYARHFFLRLFGLSGKTVIFDEVHAYDFYMGFLFIRLLAWLRELGTHVIVLSATLPAFMRDECLEAWGVLPPKTEAIDALYPAVWQAVGEETSIKVVGGFDTAWSQNARLDRHAPEPDAVATSVADAVQAGAVVGIICNTVARAQAVYRAVQERLKGSLPEEDLLLFHARYLFGERRSREENTLERFGKGRSAGPVVLVATQVAEQSLDLDFDVLFSDLAPIDLLLQRAGRLHRHLEQRPSAKRPTGYRQPIIYWMCADAVSDGLPNIDEVSGHGRVYDRFTLWKTWYVLKDQKDWTLPADYRFLVETVYNPIRTSPPDNLSNQACGQWEEARSLAHQGFVRDDQDAEERLIPGTQELDRLLILPRRELADDEDKSVHADLRAMTRQGDSIEVVVLHEASDGTLFLDPTYTEVAPLKLPASETSLSVEEVRNLLGNAVRLSYDRIIGHVQSRPDSELPEAWLRAAKYTPALRYKHLLCFQNRRWSGGGYRIDFDDELGLVITRT